MSITESLVPRRALLAAAGLGAAAAATLNRQAAAAVEQTATEAANIQLVRTFCKSWGDGDYDSEKLVNTFMAEDCVVRFGDTVPPASGRAAVIGLFKTFLDNGERYNLKILDVFARGAVVVTSRIDSTIKDDRSTHPTAVVGVFVIRDNKIKEWSDYV
jgi:limonene-1,2-epoxide hydrolase